MCLNSPLILLSHCYILLRLWTSSLILLPNANHLQAPPGCSPETNIHFLPSVPAFSDSFHRGEKNHKSKQNPMFSFCTKDLSWLSRRVTNYSSQQVPGGPHRAPEDHCFVTFEPLASPILSEGPYSSIVFPPKCLCFPTPHAQAFIAVVPRQCLYKPRICLAY